jgi:hypothetical protein
VTLHAADGYHPATVLSLRSIVVQTALSVRDCGLHAVIYGLHVISRVCVSEAKYAGSIFS